LNPGELAKVFTKHGVRYCVVGGVAATLHGVLRDTFDLDVLLVPTISNLESASAAFVELRLRPHVPIVLRDLADPTVRLRLREEKNLIAVGYVDPSDPLRRVDVLLDGPFDVETVVLRAESLAGIPIIGVKDLIEMKRAAGRPKDLDDAAWLERLEDEG
jgi:hypothetical protein